MHKRRKMKEIVNRLSCWDKPIDFHAPVEMTPEFEEYLNFYDLYIDGIRFHFGTLEINDINIMVQVFSPSACKGNVFLLHGYLDHVGSLKNLIKFLTNHHYRVISYDLQGHGLSGGSSASINDFSDYVHTLQTLLKKARGEFSEPFYIIGHSTGGAIAINYVLKYDSHLFDKVVLIAPLIRSKYWHLTKISFCLSKQIPFITKIKRKFRKNSSDKKYLSFTKKDPLQPKAIPLKWIEALIKWNKEIQDYKPTNTNTYVIQGTKDKTVDWEYNLAFIQKKFDQLQIYTIPKGRHSLLNEKANIRIDVFNKLLKFISS